MITLSHLLMKNKWYLIAFVVTLAIVGISLEQKEVPNQEIHIQFSDTEAKQDQIQHAVALVKNELNSLKIDNLRIEELANETLKISYYSDVAISDIRKVLSDAIEVGRTDGSYTAYDNSQLPFEKEIAPYHLDIYKIQETKDLNGATSDVLEPKSEATRSSSVKSYATLSKLTLKQQNNTEKIVYNAYTKGAIALNNSSNKIPESRAGPWA